jgi:hypothetical protein
MGTGVVVRRLFLFPHLTSREAECYINRNCISIKTRRGRKAGPIFQEDKENGDI